MRWAELLLPKCDCFAKQLLRLLRASLLGPYPAEIVECDGKILGFMPFLVCCDGEDYR